MYFSNSRPNTVGLAGAQLDCKQKVKNLNQNAKHNGQSNSHNNKKRNKEPNKMKMLPAVQL